MPASMPSATGDHLDGPRKLNAAPAADHALELLEVTKNYGHVNAVSDISLTLAKGEFLTLLGPSGCGKTTLMNMVAGFFHPSQGEILIEGRDVTSLMPHQRNTGIVFQNYALFPHMTVAQNVAFGLEERRVAKAEIRERVTRALAMVKLPDFSDRKPSQLSGGQQQRVALARALVIEPKVLLLDEPLSALDKNLRTHMQIEIKQIQQRAKVATIFVTHDQNEALSMSDRIAVMSNGKIEQIGTPREIYRSPQSRFVASFIGEINRIPVTVDTASADQLVLSSPSAGRFTLPNPGGQFDPRSGADLYVRPEDIEIVSAMPSSGNAMRARVTACSYQGSFTHVVLEAPDVDSILVAAPAGHATDELRPGNEVFLKLDLDRASVLTH